MYLSKNATDNFYREVILNEDWNTNYRYGHNNEVHRGHCLANKFKDYLVPKQYLNEKKSLNSLEEETYAMYIHNPLIQIVVMV